MCTGRKKETAPATRRPLDQGSVGALRLLLLGAVSLAHSGHDHEHEQHDWCSDDRRGVVVARDAGQDQNDPAECYLPSWYRFARSGGFAGGVVRFHGGTFL